LNIDIRASVSTNSRNSGGTSGASANPERSSSARSRSLRLRRSAVSVAPSSSRTVPGRQAALLEWIRGNAQRRRVGSLESFDEEPVRQLPSMRRPPSLRRARRNFLTRTGSAGGELLIDGADGVVNALQHPIDLPHALVKRILRHPNLSLPSGLELWQLTLEVGLPLQQVGFRVVLVWAASHRGGDFDMLNSARKALNTSRRSASRPRRQTRDQPELVAPGCVQFEPEILTLQLLPLGSVRRWPGKRAHARALGASHRHVGRDESRRSLSARSCRQLHPCQRRLEGWIAFGDATTTAARPRAIVDSGAFMVFGEGIVCRRLFCR
jgi:hypothetical protein